MRILTISLFLLVSGLLKSQNLDSLAFHYAQQSWLDTILEYRKENLEKFHPIAQELIQTNPDIARNSDYLSYVGDTLEDLHLYTYSFQVHSGQYEYFLILEHKDSLQYFAKKEDSNSLLDRMEVYPLDSWYGALYYKLIPKKIKGETYYFLLAFRDVNHVMNEKLIDVLYQEDGELKLGKSDFFENDRTRFTLSFSDRANVKLNYDENEKMIVYDNLIPRSINNTVVYVPDGSYKGLKWKNKKWTTVEKIYDHISKEPPRPKPVLDSRNKDIFGN